MQAVPIPKAPDPYAFNRHLNALIKENCQEKGQTFLIGHQLRLHYTGTVLEFPDGERFDIRKLDVCPVDRSLALLPVARRIRIVIDLMGLTKAAEALQLEPHLSPFSVLSEQEIKEVATFSREITELTLGVVTVYELDTFRVLRVFLFSAIGRCLQKDILSAQIAYPGHTMKGVVEQCSSVLLQMFGLIGTLEDNNTFSAAAEMVDSVIERLSCFQKPQEVKSTRNEMQQVYDEIEKIRRCLRLFVTALKKPYLYLSLMLTRVHAIPVNCEVELDTKTIDPSAGTWLHEFLLAWETQIGSFFPLIKKINAGNRQFKKRATEIENIAEGLLREARNKINPEVCAALNEIHAFEKLTAQVQWKERGQLAILENKTQELGDRIQAFWGKYQQLTQQVKELVPLNRGTLPQYAFLPDDDQDPCVQLKRKVAAEVDQPIYSYWRLAASILDVVRSKSWFYRQFYHVIDQVMTICPFRTLQHEALLNLFQWQLRAQFLSVSEQFSADKKMVDGVANYHARVDGLLARMRTQLAVQEDMAIGKKVKLTQQANDIAFALKEKQSLALLKQYYDLTGMLGHLFLMKDWQKLFAFNPFTLEKQQPGLEQQFYFELYVSCRKMVLIPQPESFLQTLLPRLTKEDEPFFSAVQRLMDDFGDLSKVRDVFRKQETPTLENYQVQARDLIARMTKFAQGIEERTGELQLSLSLHLANAESPALKELSENLQCLNEAIQSLFFSPAQPLIAHLHLEELLEDDRLQAKQKQARSLEPASRRVKTPVVKPLLPPSEALEKKTIEKTAIEPPASLWVTFQESYLGLIQYFAKRKQSESGKACLQNLAGNLSLLQNLVETVKWHGERPYFVFEANLALMVHLEQTLSILNISQSRTADERSLDVYRKMGLESEWTDHAPHLQLNHEIDRAHIAFMRDRERVIAISSRYPGSGKDRLADSAKRALNPTIASNPSIAQRYREGMQADLNSGLKACQALLDTQQIARGFIEETPLSQTELESLFAAVPALEPDWESTKDSCLSRFETALARIQQYRMVTIHREVPSSGLNGQERKGTIQLALADLEMTARLCRDMLKDDLHPSQGLIISRQAWLRQAVALERVLLIILSHLPAEEKDGHWLWVDTPPRPERYSHHLVAYTQKLRQVLKGSSQLLDETEELAKDIEPYLKTLYRYHAAAPCPAKERLDKIQGLMLLRRLILVGSSEQPKDIDQLLGASQPGERLSLLDAHILRVVRHDATRPLLETLDLAEDWLRIYEKLLLKTLVA